MINKKTIQIGDKLVNKRGQLTTVQNYNGILVNIGKYHIIHGNMTHKVKDRDCNNWRKL